MSIRSTAFFVSAAGGPLVVSATLDTITLVDFDADITIGTALVVSATLDTLTLNDLDVSVVIGSPLVVNATTVAIILTSTFADVTRTSVQEQATLFFSF